MKIYCTLIVIAQLFIFSVGKAQTDSTHILKDSTAAKDSRKLDPADTLISYRINAVYLKSIWTDLKYTVSRPAHWRGKDYLRLGIVLGTAGTLMGFDHEIRSVIQHNRTSAMTHITNQIEPFGNAYSPYIIGGMYVVGVIAKDRKLENASLMTAKSLVISTLIYTTTKVIVRRGRPTYYESQFEYNRPFTSDKYHTSFPSGHMNTVTTVATALAEIYGPDHPWVPYVSYSIAALTGATRMYQNRHWSSDVFIGGALGYVVTKSLFKHQRAIQHKRAEERLKELQQTAP